MEKKLQEQLTEVETLLEQEKAKGTQKDSDVIARLEQQQADLLLQMDAEKAKAEQEAAQQVRIQAQEENKEGLSQFVQDLDLFETFFPQDKYAEIMGLSEYVDQRQLFNQILHQAFVQIEDQRNDKHNADIAERDEKIYALKSVITQNGEQYDKHLDQLADLSTAKDSKIDQLTADNLKLSTENQSLATDSEKTQIELKQAQEQVELLTTENEKLKEQVEASKSLSPKPTASIADLLNQAKIKSSAELALERTSPFRGKVEVTVPTVEQVLPFQPNELDQGNVESSADIAAVTVPGVAEVTTFPTTFPVQSGDTMDRGISSEDGSQTEAQVTRYEFEALKADVEVLKRRQGMVA